jgi:cytochrome c-type biogenesis protein CcmH
MLVFWSLAVLLVVVIVAVLVWPLLRERRVATAPDADAAAIAVYRDQRRALDDECAEGALTTEERDAAVAELARRLGDEVTAGRNAKPARRDDRRAWSVAIALALVIPTAAALLYARLGNPGAGAPAVAGAASGGDAHEMSDAQIAAMVDSLAQRLKSRPDDAHGWVLLARSYVALGRFAEAADAYAHAVAVVSDDAGLLADYADALAMAQGRRLAGQPAALAQRALAIDPNQRKALALAATAAMEARDLEGALGYWRRLLAQFPESSDDAKQVGAIIAEVESAKRDGKAFAAKEPRRGEAPAAQSAKPVAGAAIAGRVDISPTLAAKVALSDTVFIFARAVEGSRMPLAVLRIPAKELPKDFTLDDSMGMGSGVKLSSAAAVVVEARISKTGNAMPQPGDLSGSSAPVKPGAAGVKVTIDRVVP